MKALYVWRLTGIFALALSLAALTGPLSSNFHLPAVPAARALPQVCDLNTSGGCSEFWLPAGPAEDTLVATMFTDEAAEFTDIQSATPHIDMTDWPLTPDLTGPFTTSSNFRITSTISADVNFEIQFLLSNNLWGVNFNFGNDPNGVQIRQGVAHMIDTAKYAANEPSCSGQCIALDTPNPPDNVGSLPAPNPCAWDSMFPQTSGCFVGAPGGTAYHLAPSTGANGFPYLQAPGSADLNAACAHFAAAFNATVSTGATCDASSVIHLTSAQQAAVSAHTVNFFIRNDNPPRLDLGDAYAAQICHLFTGSYTAPCLPYLSTTHGPITAFPGFTTSTSSVNLSWGMYTAEFGTVSGVSPFDSTYYLVYNSHFVSGVPSIQPPKGPCDATAVPTVSAADYMYLCNPTYDSLTNQMEFAPCLSTTGDPVVGSTGNISTGTCPGTSKLSSVGAGLQAADQFGKNAFTIEVFTQTEQFGYLNNGWIRVDNSVGSGLPGFWTWLNAWNPSPAAPGTIRQGFKSTTTSLSPYIDSTLWDSFVVGNIYDSLTAINPLSGNQLMQWMSVSGLQLPNSALTYSPPAGTVSSFRFTLRNDLFWQDGRHVTPWDVKFSYLTLKATGAFQGGPLAPMTGVTVLSTTQFDVNVNAVGPFTVLTLTSPTVIPGRYWSTCSGSVWDGYASINRVPDTCMNADPNKITANFDPLANGILIGSGPWMCKSSTGTIGSGCSSSGTMNPPVGGSYVLSRFGKGLAPASSVSSIYFRSNGNLAAYLWSQNNGDITHDFLNFSVVASCFGAGITSTGPCAHFQQGIGATGGSSTVGLQQVAIVNRFVGLNWIAPFNWATTPPLGILPLPPVLYENTMTLNPAAKVGCTTPYPTGGYDC